MLVSQDARKRPLLFEREPGGALFATTLCAKQPTQYLRTAMLFPGPGRLSICEAPRPPGAREPAQFILLCDLISVPLATGRGESFRTYSRAHSQQYGLQKMARAGRLALFQARACHPRNRPSLPDVDTTVVQCKTEDALSRLYFTGFRPTAQQEIRFLRARNARI